MFLHRLVHASACVLPDKTPTPRNPLTRPNEPSAGRLGIIEIEIGVDVFDLQRRLQYLALNVRFDTDY